MLTFEPLLFKVPNECTFVSSSAEREKKNNIDFPENNKSVRFALHAYH